MPTTTQDLVSEIIESAGYGIGYWADEAIVGEDYAWYQVREAEASGVARKRKRLSAATILRTVRLIRDGEAFPGTGYRAPADWAAQAAKALHPDSDGGEVDSEFADVIIQCAVFGTIVYG